MHLGGVGFEDCSGLLGRTLLRLPPSANLCTHQSQLFRPSRPDSIETSGILGLGSLGTAHCSGLLGRTLLRLRCHVPANAPSYGLFRPSRPDSIETNGRCSIMYFAFHCSGLLGRTLLRQGGPFVDVGGAE